MLIQIHRDSHVDHVSQDVIDFLKMYYDRPGGKVVVETMELPQGVGMDLTCGLYGPIMGDAPIPESWVQYQTRPGRRTVSRTVPLAPRLTRTLTVVSMPYDGHLLVLATCYCGPAAPKEVGDFSLGEEGRLDSVRFWSEHALSLI